MATITAGPLMDEGRPDVLSGTPRAHAIDRWIYVFMAAWFIAIILTGFIPDALGKIAMVKAGQRPPFPLMMHVHAVLMGSFLLLLLAQTMLVATGRTAVHRQLGLVAMVLVPALVVAGVILAPTIYHQMWNAAHFGPLSVREAFAPVPAVLDNILLTQMRAGILFSLFIGMGLQVRGRDVGFHKRMMILATAVTLPAGIDRIEWLPTTLPGSMVASDLYTLLAISPMFAWDLIRNGRVHRAYLVWVAVFVPFTLALYMADDAPWWHATARHIMGV